MRIAYIHQYYVNPTQPGGTRSYELARRLVARGHQVSMITTNQSEISNESGWAVDDESGISVHRITVPYSNQMGWAARLRAFLTFAVAASRKAASLDVDVIFATSTPLTVAIPALYASWRRKTPYVFEIRDVWPAAPIALGQLRNPLLRAAAFWLERTAYRRAARVVALAPGMGEHMVACGVPPEHVTIIPNGCDNDVFEAISPAPTEIRTDPWLSDRPIVLYAGALGMVSGVGYVVKLAAATLAVDPEIRYVIVGDGRDADRIRSMAVELGVLDRNLRILPSMAKRDVAHWFQASQVTLALFAGPRAVWKDAVQNKFFDALAAGKPVVSNHDGWQNEIAVEHDVGFSVSAEDLIGAARKIAAAAHDTAWLEGVAVRAKTLAHGRFSRDQQAEALETVLMAAVASTAAKQ